MFLIVNRLIALSLGVHRLQLEQRMGFTWPRPFLFTSTVRFVSCAIHKTGTSNGNIYLDALFLTIFAALGCMR